MKKIGFFTWMNLIRGLRKRGQGIRESGAFLLAEQGNSRVCKVVYYDDLDSHCLDSGIIEFDGAGYISLFKMCADYGWEVICDVHTHPDYDTSQSGLDKAHPMIKKDGHTALIVPSYAQNKFQLLSGVGIYQYEDDNWTEEQAFKISLY